MAITPAELAKHWQVARPYAYKLIKKGCPLDSFEAADSWRRSNSTRGVGFRSKKGTGEGVTLQSQAPEPRPSAKPETSFQVRSRQAMPAEPPQKPAPKPAPVPAQAQASWDIDPPEEPESPSAPPGAGESLTGLHAALRASVAVHTQAYKLVLDSMNGSPMEQELLGIRISAFTKAAEGRMKVESAFQEYEVAQERLITYEAACTMLSAAWAPLVTRLLTISKRRASEANPADPVLAEKVIGEAIRAALREAENEAFPMPEDLTLAAEA